MTSQPREAEPEPALQHRDRSELARHDDLRCSREKVEVHAHRPRLICVPARDSAKVRPRPIELRVHVDELGLCLAKSSLSLDLRGSSHRSRRVSTGASWAQCARSCIGPRLLRPMLD